MNLYEKINAVLWALAVLLTAIYLIKNRGKKMEDENKTDGTVSAAATDTAATDTAATDTAATDTAATDTLESLKAKLEAAEAKLKEYENGGLYNKVKKVAEATGKEVDTIWEKAVAFLKSLD